MSTAVAKPTVRKEADPLNLPNVLTGARFFMSIALFVMIYFEDWFWCLFIFTLAAFSDWLDGFLARKLEMGSTLGRNLDPLVDKILMCGAFTFLIPVADSAVHPWIVVVVVSRELAVTGLRSFIENRGGSFGADWLGKLKMLVQCAALFYVFMHLYLTPEICPIYNQYIPRSDSRLIRDVALYVMVAVTVLSGLQYLWRATALLRPAPETSEERHSR